MNRIMAQRFLLIVSHANSLSKLPRKGTVRKSKQAWRVVNRESEIRKNAEECYNANVLIALWSQGRTSGAAICHLASNLPGRPCRWTGIKFLLPTGPRSR